MPVRSMTLTTPPYPTETPKKVSDACQINDFDHVAFSTAVAARVSDACQINDFDHWSVYEY